MSIPFPGTAPLRNPRGHLTSSFQRLEAQHTKQRSLHDEDGVCMSADEFDGQEERILFLRPQVAPVRSQCPSRDGNRGTQETEEDPIEGRQVGNPVAPPTARPPLMGTGELGQPGTWITISGEEYVAYANRVLTFEEAEEIYERLATQGQPALK